MSGSEVSRLIKNIKKGNALIITPRIDWWLVKTDEFVLTEEEQRLLKRLLSSERGSRVGSFTGSQAGSCHRYQIFNFLGLPIRRRINPRLQNVFFDGTWRHVRWQLMLRRAIPGTDVEKRVDNKPLNLRGSVDAAHIAERWGVEIKGTSNYSSVILNGVFDHHELQSGRYWAATDVDPTWGDKPLDKWIYLYEDKRSQDWREIVVKRSASLDRVVERELKHLNNAVRDHDLPPVLHECRHGKGKTFRECPHSTHCLGISSWEQAEHKAQEVAITPRGPRKLPHHRK